MRFSVYFKFIFELRFLISRSQGVNIVSVYKVFKNVHILLFLFLYNFFVEPIVAFFPVLYCETLAFFKSLSMLKNISSLPRYQIKEQEIDLNGNKILIFLKAQVS